MKTKGGVGKSLVTMGLVHNLTQRGEDVFVIDADASNPDVFKSYENEVVCELVNLDEADGWIRFVNILRRIQVQQRRREHRGAQQSPGVAAYGQHSASPLRSSSASS